MIELSGEVEGLTEGGDWMLFELGDKFELTKAEGVAQEIGGQPQHRLTIDVVFRVDIRDSCVEVHHWLVSDHPNSD